jgi:hypothetical protein
MSNVIKRGYEFTHNRWLEDDYKTPVVAVVTRVAQGVVYYAPKSGGTSWKMDLTTFVAQYGPGAVPAESVRKFCIAFAPGKS